MCLKGRSATSLSYCTGLYGIQVRTRCASSCFAILKSGYKCFCCSLRTRRFSACACLSGGCALISRAVWRRSVGTPLPPPVLMSIFRERSSVQKQHFEGILVSFFFSRSRHRSSCAANLFLFFFFSFFCHRVPEFQVLFSVQLLLSLILRSAFLRKAAFSRLALW
jgi:hypothetical protein